MAKKYAIVKRYCFKVEFIVLAEDEQEAEDIVNNNCNADLGRVTSDAENVESWQEIAYTSGNRITDLHRIPMED